MSLFCAVLFTGFFCAPTLFGQSPVITKETMGTVAATTAITAHETANGFINTALTMTNGGAAASADLRATSVSTTAPTYTGASGSANVFFSGTGTLGFAIEGIDASAFTNLQLQFGYRKESATVLPTLAVEYWNGSAWVGLSYTFNEITTTAVGWYLTPVIALPAGAQIAGLKLRWVKSGTQSVRIDDVTLTGTGSTPVINVTGSFSKFYANDNGLGSDVQSVTVNGGSLTNNIVIGPLTGYEFSTSSTGPFSSSLTLNQTSGTVPNTLVYARLSSSSAVGTYSGNISFVSSPATTVDKATNGQVYSNGSAFTTGNIVTLRVGEIGGDLLTTGSAPVFIDEYTTNGVFVQSVPLPFKTNGSNKKFSVNGMSTTEGFLNLSPDGQYLTFGGYDAIPGVTGISTTATASYNRVVARVTQNGTINTTTAITDGFSAGSIRSAATVDGTSFWTGGAGTGGGTRYVTLGGTTSTLVSAAPTNTRGTAIYNSQLYTSSQSGTNIGISTVGSGLPTTTGNITTILSGTATNVDLTNPQGFVFGDMDGNGTPEVLYAADGNLGIVKFSNNGGVWTKRGSLPNPSGRASAGLGLQMSGTDRVLFICLGTSASPANEIYKFVDNSAAESNITSSGTDIITACGAPIITSSAPTTMLFKGVSFAPVNVPTPTIQHTFTTPASSVSQGTSEAIYAVELNITDGSALLTGLTVQTSGAYLGSDFINFKLVLSTNSTYDVLDPVLATISSSTGPGQTLAFTGLGQNLPVNTTRYLFVVASASGCASVGNTIEITSTPLTSITYSNPSSVKNGSPAAGASVTTAVGVLDNVTSFTAVGGQPTVQLSWTNPACITEVVIVAHTAPITGVPSGSYVGSTNYLGSGSAFPGGGRVVYVGSASPQTITGLTLNQLYYFKAFVKFNTNYSPGVQVTATPTLVNIYSRGSGSSHSGSIWSLSPTGTPQTLSAIGGMSTSRGLVIQSGDTVDLSQSGGTVVCRELIVENGAVFKTNLATNTYLSVYGDVTNNGVIGTGESTINPICLNVEGTSVYFKGSGVSDYNIIRKNTATNQQTTLFFQSDVDVLSTGTTGLYTNFANTRLNSVIFAGKTLRVFGDVALDGFNGTDASERAGNIINNGNLYVGGTLFLRNNNTTASYGCAFSTGANSYTEASNLFTDLSLGQTTNVNLSSSSKVDILGTLTVTSGTLSSNGAITLKSNSTSTARIANSGGTISGNITSERFVPNSGWHLTGTLFSGQTITDWRDDLPGSETQGPMPGVHTPNPGYKTSMIFGYDQSNNDAIPYDGGTTNGWVVPTTSSIEQYKGYRTFIGSSRTLDNTGIYNMNPSPISLDYNPTSTYAGWNLVMNPHLCAINTSGFTWGAGVQQVVVVWNPVTSQYQYTGTLGSLTGVTLNNSITPIASGQSFFVKCTQASTLTIPQTAKASTSGSFFRTATENQPNALEIRIKNEDSKFDATLLQFVDGTQMDYEPSYDASKLPNDNMNIYTIYNGTEFAINAMPDQEETMIVPLGFSVNIPGTYGFQFDGINLVNGYDKIYLRDYFNGTIQEVSSNTMTFYSEPGKFNTRFEIIFTNSITSVHEIKNLENVKVYPNPVVGDKINVNVFDKSGKVQITMSDLLGRIVTNGFYTSSDVITISKPSSGQYILRVVTPKSSTTKNILVK
jgi:hypothetical protein